MTKPHYGARVVAAERYRLTTVTVRDDSLSLILQGVKGLHTASTTLTAGRDQGVMIARGTQWDVVNDPRGQGQYEALVLAFDDAMVREFNRLHPLDATAVVASAQVVPIDAELREAVLRTLPPVQAGRMSRPLLHHRTMEVLLHLVERGYRFAPTQELSWSDRIRRLVSQRPHAEWTVPALAEAFHMSESSLRRRMDSGGATLAALVREVRLETALGLLQTTSLPVGEVAQRCGWESHSRFSAVFQERWGVTPSVVRARMKESEQALTEIG